MATTGLRIGRVTALALAGAILAVGLRLDAMFILPELENVPIERVTQNLARQIAANPADTTARLNLARVHAMAWASKAQTVPVIAAVQRFRVGSLIPGAPYFGEAPGFQQVRVAGTADPAALGDARRHLDLAIRGYEDVLTTAPTNVVAMLGRAWCLDQAGSTVQAIEGYRAVLAAVWPSEASLGIGNFKPTTIEVAGYLIPLLDPVKDRDEIATLMDRIAQIKRAPPRPVTPIVIPLRDGARVEDLTNPSAWVTFDADGSGLAKRWTWITADAGWLVYDRVGRGQVTSALQLFGRVTFWLYWDNGYEAMRALDDNGDGELSGRELAGFAIWRDANINGQVDRGEMRSLDEWAITRLSCSYQVADNGEIAAFSLSGVTFANGVTRPTYDVLLYPR